MRTALLVSTLLLLPVAAQLQPAQAQPAVPDVPGAVAPRAAAPAAAAPPTTASPTAAAPAPVRAPSALTADVPPTADAAPTTVAPVASAAPSAGPPASAPPTATASAAPPTTDAPPTSTASAAPPAVPGPGETGAPSPDSFQTVARNSPLTPQDNAAFLAAYAARPDIQKLPNGTMYRVLYTGTGKQTPISRFDTVTVSYRGWTIDGTSFDASPAGSPRSFQINALIPGWRDALMKMKEGDLWEIVIPADQAYGAEGRAGRIPPNQTLVFVVSLAHVAYAG